MSGYTVPAAVVDVLAESRRSSESAIRSADKTNGTAISTAFFGLDYSADETAAIDSHLSLILDLTESDETMAARLNVWLAGRTTIAGFKPSVADVAVFSRFGPVVDGWSREKRTGIDGNHHLVRLVDYVQNSNVFGPLVGLSKVDIDPADVVEHIKPADMKAEKERKKREKEAAAEASKTVDPVVQVAAKLESTTVTEKPTRGSKATTESAGSDKPTEQTQKKEKKKKEKKPAPPPPVERPIGPAMIDLRVGHILRAVNHPNADSLYVSTMDCGDAPGTENTSLDEQTGKTVRTVCSGLNGLIPLEEMQGRKVVTVCNLKPVTMRGVKSCAMVLAASPRDVSDHSGPVELVQPPSDSPAGERVYFDGWNGEPEKVLNPKKKIWEAVQPGFTTTDKLEVGFDPKAVDSDPIKAQMGDRGDAVALLRTAHGLCSVKSLVGALVR